jgi:1,4-alpha-glucan branching enzyme
LNTEITIEKGGPCDGTWHDSFYWVLKRALMSGGVDIEYENLKSIIDCRKQGYTTGKNVVNYISNHDHDRLLVELGKEKQLFGEEAFHLIRLAVVVLVTSIGNILSKQSIFGLNLFGKYSHLVWMGDEFGEPQEKLVREAKLQWHLIENNEYEFNHRMFDYWYTFLLRILKANSCFPGVP